MSEAVATGVPEVDAVTLSSLLADRGLPVLVDYVADHCIWCARIDPVLAAAALKFDGQVRVVKINITRNLFAAPVGGLRATPTLAFYRNGKLVMSKNGMMQRAALESFLTHWLDPDNEGLA